MIVCESVRSARASGNSPARAKTHVEATDLGLVVEKDERERDHKGRPQAEQANEQPQITAHSSKVGKRLALEEPDERILFKRLEDVVFLDVKVVWDGRVDRCAFVLL